MGRQRLLEEMEANIPWVAFLALIHPIYPQPTAEGGRPPFPLGEMLFDTPCFRRLAGNCFAEVVGYDMIAGRIPDETTILNFLQLLEEHRVDEQFLHGVNQMLSEKGVSLRKELEHGNLS